MRLFKRRARVDLKALIKPDRSQIRMLDLDALDSGGRDAFLAAMQAPITALDELKRDPERDAMATEVVVSAVALLRNRLTTVMPVSESDAELAVEAKTGWAIGLVEEIRGDAVPGFTQPDIHNALCMPAAALAGESISQPRRLAMELGYYLSRTRQSPAEALSDLLSGGRNPAR